MPAGFAKGDRVTYAWSHTPERRGTVVGPVPYRHNDSGREDIIVEWDDDGFGGPGSPFKKNPIQQEVESYTLKKLDLITRIGDLDGR